MFLGISNISLLFILNWNSLNAIPFISNTFQFTLINLLFISGLILILLKKRQEILNPIYSKGLQISYYSEDSLIRPVTSQLIEKSQFENFFKNSPVGYLRINAEGIILSSNPAIIKILGFESNEDLLSINYLYNFHRDKSRNKDFIEQLKVLKSFTFIEYWRKEHGTIAYLKENYTPILNDKNEFKFYEIIVEDITARVKAERSLKITEEKFKLIIDQVPVGMYRVVATGEIVFANQFLANLLGYNSDDEIKGKMANDFVLVPEDNKEFIKLQIEQGNTEYSTEKELIKKDGTKIWIQDTAKIFYDTSGEVLFYDGIIEEITARKNAELELNRLITAINQISEGLIITDIKGNILYVNPAYEKMSGYSIFEIKGQNLNIFNKLLPKEYYNKIWNTVLSGKNWNSTIVQTKKSGEIYDEQMIVSPIKNSIGEITNFVLVKRDITDEKKIEQHLQQSQKLQAIGTLAGGIAHDFNNILMGMQIYTEILLKKISEDTNEHNLLQKVYTAQNRAKDLIRQILSFSRQSGDEKEPLIIHTIIKEALKLIKSTFPSTLKLETKIEDCGQISGNPTQIHQIVMNLCTNANHAMEGQGLLTIELKKFDYIEKPDGSKDYSSNKWIRLMVKDTGCGMEKKIANRIFEPFFTTKSVGQGTGLGLATVHGIVKNYGGEIYFTTKLNEGTIFYIYLPTL